MNAAREEARLGFLSCLGPKVGKHARCRLSRGWTTLDAQGRCRWNERDARDSLDHVSKPEG